MLYNLLIVNVPVKRQNTKKEPGVGEGWGGGGGGRAHSLQPVHSSDTGQEVTASLKAAVFVCKNTIRRLTKAS